MSVPILRQRDNSQEWNFTEAPVVRWPWTTLSRTCLLPTQFSKTILAWVFYTFESTSKIWQISITVLLYILRLNALAGKQSLSHASNIMLLTQNPFEEVGQTSTNQSSRERTSATWRRLLMHARTWRPCRRRPSSLAWSKVEKSLCTG